MEGVGDEVLIALGGGSLVLVVCLYKALSIFADSTHQHSMDSTNMLNSGPTRSSTHDCAICLAEASFAAQTNCSHIYCANCLLEVWRRTSQLSPISCPYCRQRVTLILPYFSQEERNTAEQAEVEMKNRLVAEIHTYNTRNSGESRSLTEILRDLPTLLHHLVMRLLGGEEGVHLAFQLRILLLAVFFILYLLSPLDLVPEAVFGILGLLDDMLIFLLISMYLTTIFRNLMTGLGQNLTAGVAD